MTSAYEKAWIEANKAHNAAEARRLVIDGAIDEIIAQHGAAQRTEREWRAATLEQDGLAVEAGYDAAWAGHRAAARQGFATSAAASAHTAQQRARLSAELASEQGREADAERWTAATDAWEQTDQAWSRASSGLATDDERTAADRLGEAAFLATIDAAVAYRG